MSNQVCQYGCGQEASFQNKSGNWMCGKSHNSCPANKRKNSSALKTSGRDWSSEYQNKTPEAKQKMSWRTGLTKETSSGVMKDSLAKKGVRRISDEERLKKRIYWEQCQFRLAGVITRVLGYDKLVEQGMYHKVHNRKGVVRDHRISVAYGYKNSIDPVIISHPANCRFLDVYDNSRKTSKCEITLDELMEDISGW